METQTFYWLTIILLILILSCLGHLVQQKVAQDQKEGFTVASTGVKILKNILIIVGVVLLVLLIGPYAAPLFMM